MSKKLKMLAGIAAWQNLLPIYLFIFHRGLYETNYWTYMSCICQSRLPDPTHVAIINF
jgi:hypothetical protein